MRTRPTGALGRARLRQLLKHHSGLHPSPPATPLLPADAVVMVCSRYPRAAWALTAFPSSVRFPDPVQCSPRPLGRIKMARRRGLYIWHSSRHPAIFVRAVRAAAVSRAWAPELPPDASGRPSRLPLVVAPAVHGRRNATTLAPTAEGWRQARTQARSTQFLAKPGGSGVVTPLRSAPTSAPGP